MHDWKKGPLILVFNKSNLNTPFTFDYFGREPSPWTTSVFNMLEYSIRGVFNEWGNTVCTVLVTLFKWVINPYCLSYPGSRVILSEFIESG